MTGEQKGDGALLTIDDIEIVSLDMKYDSAEAVGLFIAVSVCGNIREKLVNVPSGPFVRPLISRDAEVRLVEQVDYSDYVLVKVARLVHFNIVFSVWNSCIRPGPMMWPSLG